MPFALTAALQYLKLRGWMSRLTVLCLTTFSRTESSVSPAACHVQVFPSDLSRNWVGFVCSKPWMGPLFLYPLFALGCPMNRLLGAPRAGGDLGGCLWRAALPPMNLRYRLDPCARKGLVALLVRYLIPTVVLGPVGFPVKPMGHLACGGEEWRGEEHRRGSSGQDLQYQGPAVC